MGLKVWLNNSMKKIDTNLHKPVIFVGGTKYKLDKAWTFVNGEKKLIWGESGVQIDYISSTGSLGGGIVFAIGETWVNAYNNNDIYRINISNLSNPTLIQQPVTWGSIDRNNGYQDTSSTSVFDGWNSSSKTGYKIGVSNTDGSISVISSSNFSSITSNNTIFLGCTNTQIASSYFTFRIGTPVNYVQHLFFNGTENYTYTNNMANEGIHGLIQMDSNTIIGMRRANSTTNLWTAYTVTSSAANTTQGAINGSLGECYSDGTYVFLKHESSANGQMVTKRLLSDFGNILYTYQASANTVLKIIGEIDNYVYVLSMPDSINNNSVIKLLLLNKSNLTVAFEKVLPNDPFNENNGSPVFWSNCIVKPQLSRTGFLGVSTYNSATLGLRIARFSAII